MKKAIVSGATGFIGRWLVEELKKNNIETVQLVRMAHQNDPEFSGDDHVLFIDMDGYEKLPELLGRQEDCVFYHLAWDGVYGPKRTDAACQFINVSGAEKAVIAAYDLGCDRFIELGSIMEKEITALMNTDGMKPSRAYIYGEAKHFAHLLTMTKAAELGLDYICPILTNPYGEEDNSTRFINATLKKIIHNEPLEFTAGTQMYDFIHVQDAARALILLGEKGIPYHNYLIGSGSARPLREFVTVIGDTLAKDREILFGNIPYTGAKMEKEDFCIDSLKKDTGFFPEISFEEGIVRTMDWLRKNNG